MRRKLFCALLFAFFVSQTHTQGVNDTRQGNIEQFVGIGCCDILEVLSTYLLRSTGDLIEFRKCKEQEQKCLSLKLIDIFVNHSRVLLNSASGVYKNDTHILISRNVMLQNTASLVVLAFLGGSVPTEHGLVDEHLSLEYDTTLDKMLVRDSACAVNKTTYSTIVLASIALVVFFIAMQVIELEKKKEMPNNEPKNELQGNGTSTSTVGYTQRSIFPSKHLESMMRLRQ